jgi:hypothetical protein
MVKPVDIVSPEVVETDYEEITSVPEPQETTYLETAKIEKPERVPKVNKTKKKRPDLTESRSLSKLKSELRKHSDARKKTDLAIKDIENG